MRFGYVGQNLTLEVTTGGTLRLATARSKERWLEVCRRNLEALGRILRFNQERNLIFRISSQLIPLASHSEVRFNWLEELGVEFASLGRLVREIGARLSMHPGQYCIPGSPRPEVRDAALAELRYAAAVLKALGAEDGVIVIHMGGKYEGFEPTRQRTRQALMEEGDVLRFLALEHDDRIWPPEEVLTSCVELGIPLIVDNLHYDILPGGMAWPDLLQRALALWERSGKRPKFHLSSQAQGKRPGAHADFIDESDLNRYLEMLGEGEYDLMVEAKMKDKAALRLQAALERPSRPDTPAV